MNAREWLAAYAEKLGTRAPSGDEFKTLLDVAAEAAHSSERVAAPVACWLAARAGVEPAEALRLARELGESGG
jgi:Domain of unknown function (DUF6457)